MEQNQKTTSGALLSVLGFYNMGLRLPKKLIDNQEFNPVEADKEIEIEMSDVTGIDVGFSKLRLENILADTTTQDRGVYISKFESGMEVEDVKEEDTYLIQVVKHNISVEGSEELLSGVETSFQIPFQKGSIKTNGRNGIMIEELLEICVDRITTLNNKFPSEENVVAIKSIITAINALDDRTRDRVKRNVEGEHTI